MSNDDCNREEGDNTAEKEAFAALIRKLQLPGGFDGETERRKQLEADSKLKAENESREAISKFVGQMRLDQKIDHDLKSRIADLERDDPDDPRVQRELQKLTAHLKRSQ